MTLTMRVPLLLISQTNASQVITYNYFAQVPPQAAAVGPCGFHSSISPYELLALIERQRAQAQGAY